MKTSSIFKPFFDDPLTHNIFEGGRGGGKTRLPADLIVEVMDKAPLNVLCGREVQKSLKESSFLVIKNAIYEKGLGDRFNIKESEGIIESRVTGGRAVFIGLLQHTVDSIKSYESYHWAWVEEAQSVSKKSLDILIPTLRTDGWFKVDLGGQEFSFPCRMFLYTMNPYTWDDPINIVLPESRNDVRRVRVNYYDNPWFPESLEEERREAKKTMNPDEYLRIWEGIPYENADRAVMSRPQVIAAQNRTVSDDGGIVVGVDVARFGSDMTVFVKRKGLQCIGVQKHSKLDTQQVARLAAEYAKGGKIIIDDTGVGGGVTDKLQELGASVVPVNFGGKAVEKDKYPDVISEMWFNLADMIDEIGLPDDSELLMELTGRYYKYTSDERRKVESKDEYKKRTGRHSPDIADATILCYYNKQKTVHTPDVNIRRLARF